MRKIVFHVLEGLNSWQFAFYSVEGFGQLLQLQFNGDLIASELSFESKILHVE